MFQEEKKNLLWSSEIKSRRTRALAGYVGSCRHVRSLIFLFYCGGNEQWKAQLDSGKQVM